MSEDFRDTVSVLLYLLFGMAAVIFLAYWALKKFGPPK